MTMRSVGMGGLFLIVAFSSGALSQESIAPADSLQTTILVQNQNQIESWNLHVQADGKSIAKLQHEAIIQLFRFYDLNENQILEEQEFETLVSPFGLRQLPLGRMLPSMVAPPDHVDQDKDGKLSRSEFHAYYAACGLHGLWLACDRTPRNDEMNRALIQVLQFQEGDRIDRQLIPQWIDNLRRLDANADELISPGEILAGYFYPGITPTRLIAAGVSEVNPIPGLMVRTESEVETQSDHTWSIRFSEAPASLSDSERKKDEPLETDTSFLVSHSNATWIRLHVALPESSSAEATLKDLTSQFLSTAGSDGVLGIDEVEGLQGQIDMQNLIHVADANRDASLTTIELESWQNVARAFVRSVVVVTILDFQQNLFTVLDTNFDGSLSNSELRDVWKVMNEAGVFHNGRIQLDRMPRQLRVIVSQGPCQQLLDTGRSQGPAWFQALDRNQDGQISRSEFPGSMVKFKELDIDHDDVISLLDIKQL